MFQWRNWERAAIAGIFLALFATTVGLRGAGEDFPRRYSINPLRSYISFSIGFLNLRDAEGAFQDYDGTLMFLEDDIERSTVTAVIDVESIFTGVLARDRHLREEDFFDAPKYPFIIFQSSDVRRSGEQLMVSGQLTMHGVTRPVVLPLTMSRSSRDGSLSFNGEITLARHDYGIKGDFWANKVLSDEVKVGLHLELSEGASYDSGIVSPETRQLAEVFYQEAMRPHEVLTFPLRKSLDEEKDPGSVSRALCRSALRLHREDNTEKAIELIRYGLKVLSEDLDAWDLLGRLQVESRDFTSALQTYSRLLQLNPYHSGALEMKRRLPQLSVSGN